MYPTKEQILEKDPKIPKIVNEIVLSWKKEFFRDWKNQSKEVKIERLKCLILSINIIAYPTKPWPAIKNGLRYCYSPTDFTIYQDEKRPSIISTLHELSHHLYGDSELQACRWSIYLFRTCFPESYKNLKWKNHLLIK